jgi:superfamily II DNA or RNA helicase
MSNWRELTRLWTHQVGAIKTVEKYLRSHAAVGTAAALVQMPTGTGKTGVIAVSASCFSQARRVLLVCPSEALRDQLAEDLAQGFWKNALNVAPESWAKPLKIITPSRFTSIPNTWFDKPGILVSTFQTLQQIHAEAPLEFDRMKNGIDFLIADEAHYEPAIKWGRAARGLGKPTVLVTATPYRNDLRPFNVAKAYIFTYPFAAALEDRVVRDIDFDALAPGIDLERFGPMQFVDAVIDYCDRVIPPTNDPVTEPKIIVRAESESQVLRLATLLAKHGQSVVGVHQNFRRDRHPTYCYASVPPPRDRKERYWVHQNKLLEGVDDPRFSAVALYRAFGNERLLVQQIGRIIRNPARKKVPPARVIASRVEELEHSWTAYRDYDRSAHERGVVLIRTETQSAVQPEVQYVKGRFRERVDFTADMTGEVLLPKSTTVFETEKTFDLDAFQDFVEEFLKSKDRTGKCYRVDDTTRCHTFLVTQNTPFLRSNLFLETIFGVTTYRLVGSRLFFYDSEGELPQDMPNVKGLIDPDLLRRLFPDQDSRLTEVKLINTDVGAGAVRSRSISALSIGQVVPDIGDHLQIVSTVRGNQKTAVGRPIRRYSGMHRGRIREDTADYVALNEWVDWIATIAQEISAANIRPAKAFNRFAERVKSPADPTPRNILLDLTDAEPTFFVDIGSGTRSPKILELPEKCLPVQNGVFQLPIEHEVHPVEISYDTKRHRYELVCQSLEGRYYKDEDGELTLFGYLNARTALSDYSGYWPHNIRAQAPLST